MKTKINKSNKKESDDQRRKKGAPKWKRTVAEIDQINKRIVTETPPKGVLYYKYKQGVNEEQNKDDKENEKKNQVINRQIQETSDKNKIKIRFSDLPISKATVNGLFKSQFIKMTETQRAVLPHAVAGRDMVVCARTGSGKTLSYLIPIVEKLYKERWSSIDGLGALILVPTRELGIQAYEVLRSFGGNHDMSAGLVIGGKDIEKEKEIIGTMNILICTPGRLLQHMDETALFVGDNLQCLVLDEVDRLMDMGFKNDIDQIMRNLPKRKVQTLLFSATIGRKVKDLARVNLNHEHEYICIHDFEAIENRVAEIGGADQSPEDKALAEKIKSITPVKLLHYYMEIKIEDKLDTLFSFLKSHDRSKCLVFFSSRKQVRFAYQAFKSLKLGQNLFELHGKMDQNKRTAIYFQFVEKKSAILFATDIASRGIDFPSVDWVIQVDCAEDISTYIHRVGRTARYKSKGSSLLFLLPSEKKFVEKIQARQIELKKLQAAPNRQLTIKPTLQKLNAENNELMHIAKRACISYLKCVYVMKDKEVFQFRQIDAQKLAESFGLANSPEITFGQEGDSIQVTNTMSRAEQRTARIQILRENAKKRKVEKNEKQKQEMWAQVSEGEAVDASDNDDNEESKSENGLDSESEGAENEESSDDVMQPVSKDKQFWDGKDEPELTAEQQKAAYLKGSKKKIKKITKDGPFGGKNRQILDGDGKALDAIEALKEENRIGGNEMELETEEQATEKRKSHKGESYLERVKRKMDQHVEEDEKTHKEKLQEKRLKKKRLLKEQSNDHKGDEDGPAVAVLGDGADDGEGQEEYTQEPSELSQSVSDEPPQKRQKVDKKSAEQRALELLDQEF